MSTDAFEALSRQFDDLLHALDGQQLGHLCIPDVYRGKGTGNLLGILHHAPAIRSGPVGEDLRVSRIGDAGQRQRLLIDRGGRNGGDVSGQRRIDGGIDIGKTRSSRVGVNPSRCERGMIQRSDIRDGGLLYPLEFLEIVAAKNGEAVVQLQPPGAALQDVGVTEENRYAESGNLRAVQRVQANLRTDSGRVTHGKGDGWFVHV